MIMQMDKWLENYAKLTAEKYEKADAKYPGTGAAGGMGFAFLAYTNAVLESGIKIILEETNLENYVKDADMEKTSVSNFINEINSLNKKSFLSEV